MLEGIGRIERREKERNKLCRRIASRISHGTKCSATNNGYFHFVSYFYFVRFAVAVLVVASRCFPFVALHAHTHSLDSRLLSATQRLRSEDGDGLTVWRVYDRRIPLRDVRLAVKLWRTAARYYVCACERCAHVCVRAPIG